MSSSPSPDPASLSSPDPTSISSSIPLSPSLSLPRRWSVEEHEMLTEIRSRLSVEIAAAGQFPEVVGDRAIIRFIRGHNHNIDKATEMYASFLQWRKESNADEAREDIVKRGMNDPLKFPFGKIIIENTPQIICAGDALDTNGNPIAFETYNFSPSHLLKTVSIEDYKRFVVYCLQYKTLIIEQLSELKERQFLEQYDGHPTETENGYGIILQCTIIRCLKGMGMEFMGQDFKAVLKATMEIAQANFPEMLFKNHIVNAPWIFNTMWYFVKGLLDVRTASKVNFISSPFLSALSAEVPLSSIPVSLGGSYQGWNTPFEFDQSEGGLLVYPSRTYPYHSAKLSATETTESFGEEETKTNSTEGVTVQLEQVTLQESPVSTT